MSRLSDLIAQAKAKDPQLGADLDREVQALSSRLAFGLNFERHRPEAVELPQRPVRRGDKVRVLPPRGSTARGDQRLWVVKAIHKAKKTADLDLMVAPGTEAQTAALEDLVVVAEFRDTIYPGLISTGKVERGGDKPWHTVINGENYHALKALTWTHRGRTAAASRVGVVVLSDEAGTKSSAARVGLSGAKPRFNSASLHQPALVACNRASSCKTHAARQPLSP